MSKNDFTISELLQKADALHRQVFNLPTWQHGLLNHLKSLEREDRKQMLMQYFVGSEHVKPDELVFVSHNRNGWHLQKMTMTLTKISTARLPTREEIKEAIERINEFRKKFDEEITGRWERPLFRRAQDEFAPYSHINANLGGDESRQLYLFYCGADSYWFICKGRSYADARSIAREEFGAENVREIRLATDDEIKDYMKQKGLKNVWEIIP